jgi:hypothetical protein
MQVRQSLEAIGDEGESYARHPRRAVGIGERARETKRAVAGEDEGEESGEAMHCERAHAEGEEREEQERDAVIVFGEGERVAVWIKDGCVEQVSRVVKGLMEVPPERVGDVVRVAEIGDGIQRMTQPRPRHQRRQSDEGEKDQTLVHEGSLLDRRAKRTAKLPACDSRPACLCRAAMLH